MLAVACRVLLRIVLTAVPIFAQDVERLVQRGHEAIPPSTLRISLSGNRCSVTTARGDNVDGGNNVIPVVDKG